MSGCPDGGSSTTYQIDIRTTNTLGTIYQNAVDRHNTPIIFRSNVPSKRRLFKGFKWLIQTTDFHGVGETVGIRLNPEDIHIMKKSEYSGMFGDYSSYSAEYDEIGDAESESEE